MRPEETTTKWTRGLVIGVLGLALIVASLPVAAQEAVPVEALLLEPALYDETRVTIVGELVGDYSRRSAITWIQLNDDVYVTDPMMPFNSEPRGANSGIGVKISTAHFDETISSPPGRYGWRGPEVAVSGIFYHLDPDEGGETYVAAESIRVLSDGHRIPTEPIGFTPVLGLVLIAVGLLLYTLARRRNVREGIAETPPPSN
ncbi:MAG: hypothetical protein GEU79_03055 [Acidimicrobiia bacterium]|nr:hypothetical protein [Acidimicrobiia bacterium]